MTFFEFGAALAGFGDMVVEPLKTTACEYVSLFSDKVRASFHDNISSLILCIQAANAPFAMGHEVLCHLDGFYHF